MKCKTKIIISICIIIAAIITLLSLSVLAYFGAVNFPFSTKIIYYINYKDFNRISEYIQKLPYDEISIQSADFLFPEDGKYGMMRVYNNEPDGYIKIEDEEIVNILNKLFTKSYCGPIIKNTNSIIFQHWTRFRYADGGVVYSIDGTEPSLDYQSKLVPLKAKNWYYYESDYIEWKNNNSQQN